jgi:hypothetical protein
MAPKRQVEKVEAKQVLTAVLLADSFTQVGKQAQQTSLFEVRDEDSLLSFFLQPIMYVVMCCKAPNPQRHSSARSSLPQSLPVDLKVLCAQSMAGGGYHVKADVVCLLSCSASAP